MILRPFPHRPTGAGMDDDERALARFICIQQRFHPFKDDRIDFQPGMGVIQNQSERSAKVLI